MLPFSAAADRNKDAILEALAPHLFPRKKLLEIGSGNGQHAIHITKAIATLTWQCSDLPENLPGISARLSAEGNERTPDALPLDVTHAPWPLPLSSAPNAYDVVFTANTLHIMSFDHVVEFFERVSETLSTKDGILCVYGPLKYNGEFTTPSNEAFDAQLKSWSPVSGIRDFEKLDELAHSAKLECLTDKAMPANNQLVIWKRG